MRALLPLLLVVRAAAAEPVPISCTADGDEIAREGRLGGVLRLDCDIVGPRAAYTLDAHQGAHDNVRALDAMIDKLTEQRDDLRGRLLKVSVEASEGLTGCADALEDLSARVADAPEPPSRLAWFLGGAGAAAALVVAAGLVW